MAKKQGTQFETAEALGEIKTMPEDPQEMFRDKEIAEIPNDPNEFRIAIGHAQMDGQDSIEVGPELFKYLLRNAKSKYLTYGDPGIKVFLSGTREDIETLESLSAEQYHDAINKKKAADAVK